MIKYKKRLSAKKKKQRNNLRRSGKYISSTITQSGGAGGVKFLVDINSGKGVKFTCMAIHPYHPLLAVCDENHENRLYRIVESRPNPKFYYIDDPAYLSPTRLSDGSVTCITFHPTLPLVVGINNEIIITVWNIQELVDHIDQVPLNVEKRRNELREMIKRPHATKINELNKELDDLKDPELNSFATTTITGLKLSCVAFHPTMPFIVVGCRYYKSNPNLSIIKIFHIVDANITEVNKNSIIIPIDEKDTVYDIESIVFSHDGVFLAATFGEKVRVWIFSPTENMKEIGNIDMKIPIKSEVTIVIKSLVFSPREPILVIGVKHIIYLVGVEKSGLTVISTHRTDSEIVTLAFHPTLPLLACSLANLEIRYYVIYDDTLTELKFFMFKTHYRFDRIAFNKQFFVVCGDDDKRIFTYAIEDELLHDVRSMLKTYTDNYSTAKLSLVRRGVIRELRDVILKKAYPHGDAFKSIKPYKEIVGEKTFLDFIELLSDTHTHMKQQLVQEFIDLLKISPNLPPVLVPFREIITNYYIPPLGDSVVIFDSADYIQTCDDIVQRFITENGLDPESELVKKIKAIFTNIVRILIDYQDTISVRNDIQAFILEKLFPFLQQLFTLNQSAQNHLFIKDINLNEWFKYAKAERDFTINKLKFEDPSTYSAERDDKKWNKILKELALKRANADARRQTKSQVAVAQGGTRRKMRARTYKKYIYKR